MVVAIKSVNGTPGRDTNPKIPAVLVGCSSAIEGLRKLVDEIANSSISILILGETGTGKTHLARYIHEQSNRTGPFIEVTCGALTDSLGSGELFGSVKGSYTGAFADRQGLFQAANNGTLFFDELGDLSPEIQARIITAVGTGRIRRVGAISEEELTIRFLCATNRDISGSSDSLRPDLLRRLSSLRIRMPPIRDHPEDIPDLVHHFLATEFSLSSSEPIRISDSALSFILKNCHLLTGNVGQLASIVAVAAQFARNRDGVIDISNPALSELFFATSQLSFAPGGGSSVIVKTRFEILCDSINSILMKLSPKELFDLPIKNNSNKFVPLLCKLASIFDPSDVALFVGHRSEVRSLVLNRRNAVLLGLYSESADCDAIGVQIGLCGPYVRNLIREARSP